MSSKPRFTLSALSVHGRWVRWIEYTTGKTRTDIAAELGRSSSTLASYCRRATGEHKAIEPTTQTWHKLAAMIGVTHPQYQHGPPDSVPELVRRGDA